MTDERFLVTGALGCIGSWTIRRLVREGIDVVAYDLNPEPDRWRALLTDEEIEHVHIVAGNVTDCEKLESSVVEFGITHIIHLAGMQVPLVRAKPLEGAITNVGGTVAVVETVRRRIDQIRGFVYASSAAVWGRTSDYRPGSFTQDAPHRPHTLYGVFKEANEGTARIYWEDWGVPSVGLRPHVVYGPGRDQGSSSFPTKAILAAAIGHPYQLRARGRVQLQFVDDVARIFIKCARSVQSGASTYDLGGPFAGLEELVTEIEHQIPASVGNLTFGDEVWQVPEFSGARLEADFGPIEWTPLRDGIRVSVELFRDAVAASRLDAIRVIQSDALGQRSNRRR